MPDTTIRLEGIEACLAQILERTDFPVLAENIREVLAGVEDRDASLRHVTNAILKDPGLTLRVLRAANSPQYNRGQPIHTVAHALALVGLDPVRDMALSLLLFQHFRASVPAARQLLLLSLLSANHGRETAAWVKYPLFEQAYLCGMFRNLGEILLACYYPAEYAAVLIDMNTRRCSSKASCHKVLGFTYEDLGRRAAESWKLPENVVCTIAETPATMRPRTELDWLRMVTNFGHDLTTAIHRLDPEGARARIGLLVQDYAPALGLRLEDIQEIAASAIRETRAMFGALRVPMDELRLRRMTEHALDSLPPEPVAETPAEAAEPGPDELLERMGQEIESEIASRRYELNHVLMMILETMVRGLGFDRAMFCLVDSAAGELRARLGLGPDVESLLDRFRFPLTSRAAPLDAVLSEHKDLIVHDGRFANSEFGKVAGAPFFGLYPVTANNVLVGCFYFDRRQASPPLEPRRLVQLRRLRDLAASVIRK
ncbi:MAG: HDOD domain-containing protein [Bryobacteraceae bacterium]